MDALWELLTSEQGTRVFETYWPWILAGLAVIAKLVRKSTLHWALWPKATRVIGLLIEVMDFIHLPKLKPGKQDFAKADRVAYNQRDPEKRRRISERVEAVKTKTNEYPKVGK